MNTKKKILVWVAVLTPLAAIPALWPKATPDAAKVAETNSRKPAAARSHELGPAQEEELAPVPGKRVRDPITPKAARPTAPAAMTMSEEQMSAMIAGMEKGPRQKIERDLQALKKAIPSLRADQEKQIREALEASLPKISRNEGGLGIKIEGGSGAVSIDSSKMKDLIAGMLDPTQLQSYNELLDGRKRSRDEATATRGYSRALDRLPDLAEEQKTALHDYFLNHAGKEAPTRDQQREELASILKPEEIESLGDTHTGNLPGFELSEGISFGENGGAAGAVSISSSAIGFGGASLALPEAPKEK